MPDSDAITNLEGWVPELELDDIATRLVKIYTYLSQYESSSEDILNPIGRLDMTLEVNGKSMLRAITEMIDQIHKQESIGMGDDDINDEVMSALQQVAIDIESAISGISDAHNTLVDAAGGIEEAKETISDLAALVANY